MAQPYQGDHTQLVLSVDIGAAYSGVTWQIFEPGEIPSSPQPVTAWPQYSSTTDTTVPTVILYKNSEAIAFGHEAASEYDKLDFDFETIEDHTLLKNFKLHLHTDAMMVAAASSHQQSVSTMLGTVHISGGGGGYYPPSLPEGVSIANAYTDYATFLLNHAKKEFATHRVNGWAVWESLLKSAHFVLGAPNGWTPVEHDFLKKSIQRTPFWNVSQQIFVVTEAEASLHHILNPTSRDVLPLKDGMLFTIVDAGGSTVDTTQYVCSSAAQLVFEEVVAPDCLGRAGIFISEQLENKLQLMFSGTREYSNDREYAKEAIKSFNVHEKRRFESSQIDAIGLSFGPKSYKEAPTPSNGMVSIKNGKIFLEGHMIAEAFDACIDELIERVRSRDSDIQSEVILLVGGLGDSPYLYRRLQEAFGDLVQILKPPEPGVKAVSVGGCGYWRHKNAVAARSAMFSYGIELAVLYKADNPEHFARSHAKFLGADGQWYLKGGFESLIRKSTVSTGDQFQSHKFVRQSLWPPNMDIKVQLFIITAEAPLQWLRDNNGKLYSHVVSIGHITGKVPSQALQKYLGPSGPFYIMEFAVGVSFGGVAIRARIESVDQDFFNETLTFDPNPID